MPVIYVDGDPYVTEDVYGDTVVANWGAPLTWGCSTVSCMSVDYTHVQYLIDGSNRLIRQVIRDSDLTVYGENIMAQNMSNLQVTDNGGSVDVTLTAQLTTNKNRTVTESRTFTVYLRNKG